jgi:H-type lectin domain
MKRLNAGLVGVEQGSLVLFSDFEDGGVMWTGDGPRRKRRKVRFSESFASPPSVQVALSMWDLDRETNPRADISAIEISETGFTILFQTWGDTRIARVRADWMAIGALPDDALWEVD